MNHNTFIQIFGKTPTSRQLINFSAEIDEWMWIKKFLIKWGCAEFQAPSYYLNHLRIFGVGRFMGKRIEAETKWPLFRRRRFQVHSFEWKYFNFYWNFTDFFPKGQIDHIPELVQVMAWRQSGEKPSSEPMMVRIPTHICVTRRQWVKGERTMVEIEVSIPILSW